MKRIIAFLVFALFVAIVVLQSCDKVDGPFREAQNIDTSCSFTPLPGGAFRKVLVEEFTGHLCGNCPPASIYLSDTLKPEFQDSLIVVVIHAGQFAGTCPISPGCPSGLPDGAFSADFSTSAGDQWNADYNTLNVYPIAMVNRIGFPGSHLKGKSQWKNLIKNQLLTLATARLRIANTFDESTRRLRTCIESKFLTSHNDTIKLQVVLTEDSIIDWQVWYGNAPEDIPDYTFHHLMRASINSAQGTVLVEGGVNADSTIVNGFYYDIPTSWNAAQCHVVAYLYKSNTREVVQAEEMKIK
jgi:hypothetical protein